MAFNPYSLMQQLDRRIRNTGKLGVSLEFDIEVLGQEDVSRTINAPEKPVEAGYEITDNASLKPLIFSISVISNSWNYADQRRALETMADRRTVISYFSPVDKKTYRNMIIEKLDFKASVDQSKGFTATIKLKQLRIVTAKDATYTLEKDSKGTLAQGEAGATSDASLQKDEASGKTWSSDSLVFKYFN